MTSTDSRCSLGPWDNTLGPHRAKKQSGEIGIKLVFWSCKLGCPREPGVIWAGKGQKWAEDKRCVSGWGVLPLERLRGL